MNDASITKDAHLLEPLLTEQRIERIENVLSERTRNLTVVLEDLYDPHNMAAVLRTCDAFGVQDIHAIAGAHGRGRFNPSRKVAGGVLSWLTLHQWASPQPCVRSLKEQGFQIAVADLQGEQSLYDIDFSKRTALVFGNEKYGVTGACRDAGDVHYRIPILGFVESFNISVAAALCLHHAVRQRQKRLPGGHGDLPDADREILRAKWTYESVRNASVVLSGVKDRQRNDQEEP